MRFLFAAACLVASLLFGPVMASTDKPVMMVWMVGVVTPRGTVTIRVPETTRFQTIDACESFGDKMRLRAEDWVRGRLYLDWPVPVTAVARCSVSGERRT